MAVTSHVSDFFLTVWAMLSDDDGQGLAEYGLILGLIAVLCIAAVLFLSGNIQNLLSNVGSSI
jgi:pilus assembly protein Flp/PilA